MHPKLAHAYAIYVGFLFLLCQGGFYPCMRGETALLMSHTRISNRPAVITRALHKQPARTNAEGPRPFSGFEEADTPCQPSENGGVRVFA